MNAKWENVLLTSSGFLLTEHETYLALVKRFAKMLGKPFSEAKVLFIPTAAYSPPTPDYEYADRCKHNLLNIGVPPESIVTYDIDGSLTLEEAMEFDALFFTGGNTPYLGNRVRETGFDEIIRAFVYANKVYVGISAGSIIMAAQYNSENMEFQYPMEFTGLDYLHTFLTVHNEPGTPARTDLPLPHIALANGQALAVSSEGFELVE